MRFALVPALFCVASLSASAAPRVSAESTRAVLGETTELTLHVTSSSELSASVSSGALREIARTGDDHTFRYTLPDLRFPTTAVFAFWESDARTPDVAVFTVPLLGRTTLEMDTEPYADVRVQVGGDTFGPEKANAKGRVKVPIAVPPGVRTAQVIATAKGQQTSRSVPLEVPKTAPYAVAVGPDPLPQSGGWVEVVSAESGQTPKLEATGAKLGEPAPSNGHTDWTLTPTGGPGSEVVLAVGGSEPRKVTLTVGKRMGGDPFEFATALPVVPHALAGAFIGGSANVGFAGELGASVHLAPFPRWLSIGAIVGFRSAGFSSNPNGLGGAKSSLLVFPIALNGRARVFEHDAFALDVLAGAGALPFRHTYSAPFEQSFSESGVGFEAFAGAEALYRLGPVEIALDLRGGFTQTRTAHLVARPGGLIVMAGARYLGK